MLCFSCIDVLTSVILPAPFFTLLMGAFNIFCEWKHRANRTQNQACLSYAEVQPMSRPANSVLESTHDKQELREAANTFNVIVKNKDDIAAIVTQAMEMMAKSQSLKSDRESSDSNSASLREK